MIALMLTLCAVFLFACNEADFYDTYGEPQQISVGASDLDAGDPSSEDSVTDTHSSTGEQGSGEASNGSQTDGDGSADLTPSDDKTADGTKGGDPQTQDPKGQDPQGGGSQTDDPKSEDPQNAGTQNGGTQNAGTQNGDTNGNGGTSGDSSTTGDPDQTGEKEDDEQEELDRSIFDLSVEYDGLCRFVRFDATAEPLPVYVGTERVGSLSISAEAMLNFDGFEKREYELWGAWDDTGHLVTFVRFDLAGNFREIVFRYGAAQLDLTKEELQILHGASAASEQTSTEDGTGSPVGGQGSNPTGNGTNGQTDTTGGDTNGQTDPTGNDPDKTAQKQTGGEEDPDQTPSPLDPENTQGETDEGSRSADWSALEGSVAYSLWEGLPGRMEGLEITYMDAEGEDYRFVLGGDSRGDLDALLDRIAPYSTYSEEEDRCPLYEGELVLGKYAIDFSVQLAIGTDSFLADVKVLAMDLTLD